MESPLVSLIRRALPPALIGDVVKYLVFASGNGGRGLGKTGVAVAVERREKTACAARLAVVPRATTGEWTSFVQDVIRPRETTVFTDAWGAYTALGRLGIDPRPRKGGRGRQVAGLLPWAHALFGNLKTWLEGTFHGVSPKHLQRYLDEFVFRFDRRWQETELFIRVLNRATQAVPCSYRQLTAERIG